jgi:hypothetical protein
MDRCKMTRKNQSGMKMNPKSATMKRSDRTKSRMRSGRMTNRSWNGMKTSSKSATMKNYSNGNCHHRRRGQARERILKPELTTR